MNDLFEDVDVIPPFDKSMIVRCKYMLNDEFRNVRVACIDTSTPRLFVEFCWVCAGTRSIFKGGGDGLSVSEYTVADESSDSIGETDSFPVNTITIISEAGSQDLSSCQVRSRAHIVWVASY